jgi:hypothetical protein
MKFESVGCPIFEVVLNYVVVGGENYSVELLQAEKVDLIVFASILSKSIWSTMSHCSSSIGIGPADRSGNSCFGITTHPPTAGRSAV